MVELAVVGARNSGKTTVIEALIGYLKAKGYRVGTIKHTSHSHRFDTPGKDSHRHREAGAALTVAVSDEETAVFAQPDALDARQLQHLTHGQIDIWLVEGDRKADRPKVMITRQLKELSGALPDNIVATIGPERLGRVSAHFETGDYSGLGSFVTDTMLHRKADIQK